MIKFKYEPTGRFREDGSQIMKQLASTDGGKTWLDFGTGEDEDEKK